MGGFDMPLTRTYHVADGVIPSDLLDTLGICVEATRLDTFRTSSQRARATLSTTLSWFGSMGGLGVRRSSACG